MPLYMDIHKFAEITIEDVKKAHVADKAIQDRYGVKYHQFWVNKEAGMVFCLCEGPDKETCALVHQLAHGNIACNIVEVEPGYYKLLMGDGQPVEHGLVQNDNGSADPATDILWSSTFGRLITLFGLKITNIYGCRFRPKIWF